jgi:hypothetical protein
MTTYPNYYSGGSYGAPTASTQIYTSSLIYDANSRLKGVDSSGTYIYPLTSSFTPASNPSTIVIEGNFYINSVIGGSVSYTGVVMFWNNGSTLLGSTSFVVYAAAGNSNPSITVPFKYIITNSGSSAYSIIPTIAEIAWNTNISANPAFSVNLVPTVGDPSNGIAAFAGKLVPLVVSASVPLYTISSSAKGITSGVSSGYTISEYV